MLMSRIPRHIDWTSAEHSGDRTSGETQRLLIQRAARQQIPREHSGAGRRRLKSCRRTLMPHTRDSWPLT